jgi:hypothetical protein
MNVKDCFAVLFGVIGIAPSLGAQTCIKEYRDATDQFQISSIAIGESASMLFQLPLRSTDCVRTKIDGDEYGCDYRTKQGIRYKAYSGDIVEVLLPASAMSKSRTIARLSPFESLASAIRKLDQNLPEEFPVWRANYDSRERAVILSTGQCLVSRGGVRWELILNFDTTGHLAGIVAYVPYP